MDTASPNPQQIIDNEHLWVAKTSSLSGLIDYSALAGKLFGDVVFDCDDPARPPFGMPIPFTAFAGESGPAPSTDGAQAIRSQTEAPQLGPFAVGAAATVLVRLAAGAMDG
jgi:hypothetical protein